MTEYAEGTKLTFDMPWGVTCFGKAMCPDGVVRSFRGGTADTFFSIPCAIKARGKTVSGYVTTEAVSGSSVVTDDDPAIIRFIPYKYGKNWKYVYPQE